MSKKEILTQVYPDELEEIFEYEKINELKRYENYLWHIRAVAAGMGAKTKDGSSLYEIYTKEIADIIKNITDDKQEQSFDVNKAYYEYKELKEKDNLTKEEQERHDELKKKLNDHIDNEINKLRNINQKPQLRR